MHKPRFSRGAVRAPFRKDSRGNVTVVFAFALLASALAVGAAVDYGRFVTARTDLAAAVDAAVLQVGSSDITDRSRLQALASTVLRHNFMESSHGHITEMNLAVSESAVNLTATAEFKTSFMSLAGLTTSSLTVSAEAIRAANNLEISLVLDTTGSMRGTKLTALKDAASEFVETVVWDNQTRTYSKIALIPYSMGVNLGSRAADARGRPRAGTCTTPGCESLRFRNMDWQNVTFGASTCVSERTGAEAFTDRPPTTAPVGWNYASPNNPCLDSELIPLTANKTAVLDAIDDLTATGSTAGQIGIAWGWYALSRDFGMWSGTSQPAAYDTRDVSKIAVIMTDGDFNTSYCNGVISRSSGSGSGSRADKINCDAPNGAAGEQARSLCAAMKRKGIIIYTIGFDVEETATR